MLVLLLTCMLTWTLNIEPVSAETTTIYVDDDNSSGPWNGTPEHPYQNITSGLEQALAGYNISVYNGAYYEHIVVDKSVSLVGESKYTTVIDGSGTGTVVRITQNNVNISGFTIRKSREVNPEAGIRVSDADYCKITNNIITENNHGIYLKESSNNIIVDNNVASNDEIGIYLDTSPGNTVLCNYFADNYGGVFCFSTSNNVIIHNAFVNNGYSQGYDMYGTNIWDDGYPSGGNYWNDYTGVDIYSGPYQNEPGSDGIGDTPYTFYTSSQDNYPLMNPKTPDTAIMDITRSKNSVGQGFNLRINVTAANEGNYAENFDVTVYANTTVIQTKSITLLNGSSTTVTLTWNTTDFTKGNYTISAYSWPVPGETETTDNTYIDGVVTVTIPGDVDVDFDVDIYDVVKMCNCYGSEEDDPEYDVNCDVDGDGDIDIYDIVAMCNHYGETYP
jgi:parallel beta-helix repeat protein